MDEDEFEEVGGAMGGCDCPLCMDQRRAYYAEQADAAVPVADPVLKPEVAAKPKKAPKPRRKQRAKVDPNVSVASITLLPPAPVTLQRAIDVLMDPVNIASVREAKNISHWAMVGPLHTVIEMNRICHAGAMTNISRGKNYPEPPTCKFKCINGRYQYWNDIENKWQDKYFTLTKEPKRKKRAVYHYRYYVTWTNERQKPEYHKDHGQDYTPSQAKAIKEFLYWLRNNSCWSRFFVGPKDRKTLFNYGCILDLSAPACVVHMLATAWRISGEYAELPEEWYAIVQKGIDPHLAFGLAQNVSGFTMTSDPKAIMDTFYSKGHNLLGQSSIEQLARLTAGMLCIEDKKRNLRPARKYYTTATNYAYRGGGDAMYADFDETGWLGQFPLGLKEKRETPNPFKPDTPFVTTCLSASLFHSQWDAGFVWILGRVGEYMKQRGWKGYG